MSVEHVEPMFFSLHQSPEKKVGYIKKEGHLIKNWKLRYFVLTSTGTESSLNYYEKPSSSPPFGTRHKGLFIVNGYAIQRVGTNMLILTSKTGHILKLDFERNDREEWAHALRNHMLYTEYHNDSTRRSMTNLF